MRSIVLEWSRYKAVRSIVFMLRQNQCPVSVASVLRVMQTIGTAMHRGALCRYMQLERYEDALRRNEKRRAALTEPEWYAIVAAGTAAPQSGTVSATRGKRSEPEIKHENEVSGNALEPSTRQIQTTKQTSRGIANALPRPETSSEAVAESYAQSPQIAKDAVALSTPPILSEPMPAAASAVSKPPKQGKLAMPPPPEKVAAGKLLEALWQRVQPVIGRNSSKTAWRKVNIVVATDLIASRAGDREPDTVIDELLVEHERLSTAAGGPLYSIARFQRELIADAVAPLNSRKQQSRANIIVGGEAEYKAKIGQFTSRGAVLRRMIENMDDEARARYIAEQPETARLAGYV